MGRGEMVTVPCCEGAGRETVGVCVTVGAGLITCGLARSGLRAGSDVARRLKLGEVAGTGRPDGVVVIGRAVSIRLPFCCGAVTVAPELSRPTSVREPGRVE